MPNKTLTLKTVIDLCKQHFYVAEYQRGYKWGTREIESLLDDIDEFSYTENQSNFYCLQPLIVRHRSEGNWELIDGQQRLTTIFLILKYLGEKSFDLTYATRDGSTQFLAKIDSLNIRTEERWDEFLNRGDDSTQVDNIDNYHFFKAWQIIAKWFTGKSSEEIESWEENLLERTEFIWYEAYMESFHSRDSIELFSRINSGKIPLTNAELVKALFLMKIENLSTSSTTGLVESIRSAELALEWDQMENWLQKDEVWFFINTDALNDPRPNRLEFILDLVAKKPVSNDKPFFTFHKFFEEKEDLLRVWKEVKATFSQLQELYFDVKKYHYTGFLISNKVNFLDLLSQAQILTKTSFLGYLRQQVGSVFKKGGLESWNKVEYLNYKESKDKPLITNLFLLANLETMHQGATPYRFSFERYKKERWSLEHIHAQHSLELSDDNLVKKLQEDLNCIHSTAAISKERENQLSKLRKELDTWSSAGDQRNMRKIQDIQIELSKVFSDLDDEDTSDDLHGLENLALLDRDTNSRLSNSLFPRKRSLIIESDKSGKFIPPVTKNVFLKYYSKDKGQLDFWGSSDRNDYKEAMRSTLAPFLGD
jgi:hypothetical protein